MRTMRMVGLGLTLTLAGGLAFGLTGTTTTEAKATADPEALFLAQIAPVFETRDVAGVLPPADRLSYAYWACDQEDPHKALSGSWTDDAVIVDAVVDAARTHLCEGYTVIYCDERETLNDAGDGCRPFHEDDPGFDCRWDGNQTCGVRIEGMRYNVIFEDGSPSEVYVAE